VPDQPPFKVGDMVTIRQIPSNLHDAADIGTPEVFRQSLGKTFPILGFSPYGHLELMVTRKDTIWIEPEFVEPAD